MNGFNGIFPALLTPFDKNNAINEEALRALIKFNLDKGVTGFYVGGSTAEAFLLSFDERKHVYEIVSDAAKGKCKLIAHVGSISTDQAVTLARYAQGLGYDMISAVAPFYYKFTFDEIKQYYFSIAKSVDLPMLIYNFPNFSGVNLSVKDISEFLCDESFCGVKHTSNDYFALERFKTAFPDKLVYNGFDEMFLAGLSMKADGGIGSTYNVMAEKFIDIQRLFNEGKLKEAQKIQSDANAVITALCNVGVFQGEKEILNMMGFDFGKARAPFGELSSEKKEYLRQAVMPYLSGIK